MKRFQTLEEFLHSDAFSRKALSDCDLSNLDLSSFPPSTWEGFTFYKTNFTNTNIKFSPHELKDNGFCWGIEFCNFTNCDLSYLKAEDLEMLSIHGSNFTDTNFHINSLDTVYGLFGVTFGDAYHGRELDKYASKMDLETLFLNPNLSFSSTSLLTMLRNSDHSTDISIAKILNDIDRVLDIDKRQDGKLWKFWNIISSDVKFCDREKITFFSEGIVLNKNFTTLDFSEFDYDFLNNFKFSHCRFQKIIFPNSDIKVDNINIIYSKAEEVIFPTITPSSWSEMNRKRLFGNVTFYKNLYVELGRFCNGKCQFCRNQYLNPCEYDFETIFENLHKLYPYLDNIVVGGGEPTLLTEDLKKLCYSDVSNKITIFTNASLHYDELMELNAMAPLNISRHSMDDDENNKILGVEALTNLNLRFLCAFHHLKPITLCATCFENGLDSKDKILDYIKYYRKEVKIHNFLFQTLHQDLNTPFSSNTVLPISNQVFDLVINKLRKKGYEISMPIYSTGDYKLIIAKKGDIHISFKQYITKEELESKWYQSPKRTFDLSMDPSGNLYENWHQSSGRVLIKDLH